VKEKYNQTLDIRMFKIGYKDHQSHLWNDYQSKTEE